jgi:muramoyltetrapeptide carboxypeptidase
MIDGRFEKGQAGYDLDTFTRVLMRAEPRRHDHPCVADGTARRRRGRRPAGRTLTQLVASLGTPYAFDPPRGHILFIDEVAERPYRFDRMMTQLALSGLLARASGIVFGELPRCDEPGDGGPAIIEVLRDLVAGFRGPVLFGLPSGHTNGATLTLPFGVRARVVTRPQPALIVEESAVA